MALAMIASVAKASSGPVGERWRSAGSGSVVADSSGFGDPGVTSDGVSWTGGTGGSALNFDGATGHVRVPDARQL
jgi:hypothetical protein